MRGSSEIDVVFLQCFKCWLHCLTISQLAYRRRSTGPAWTAVEIWVLQNERIEAIGAAHVRPVEGHRGRSAAPVQTSIVGDLLPGDVVVEIAA